MSLMWCNISKSTLSNVWLFKSIENISKVHPISTNNITIMLSQYLSNKNKYFCLSLNQFIGLCIISHSIYFVSFYCMNCKSLSIKYSTYKYRSEPQISTTSNNAVSRKVPVAFLLLQLNLLSYFRIDWHLYVL